MTDSFLIAIVAGALVALFVGLIVERGLTRMYYGRPPEDQILVTFGIGIILVELVRSIYGGISLSVPTPAWGQRSEEHTSELQSLMRNPYAVFCLKKKTNTKTHN